MNKSIASMLNLAALIIISAFCTLSASAQGANRTWVSGVGDDANPCSRTAPCKTFQGAISKTAQSGEISALDPGGFGPVTITKAITISGEGTLAGITNAGTNGIIVNAGANDVVVIRNITIGGVGSGINGIRFLAGKQLIVENANIERVTGNGIDVALSAAGALSVIDTKIVDCQGSGINVQAGGTPSVTVDNVKILGCFTGFLAYAGVSTIRNTVISHSSGQALVAQGPSPVINAESCVLTDNPVGVNAAESGAIIRLSNCTITRNNLGMGAVAGASIVSFGNNKNTGNTTNGAPTTLLAQQ